MVYSSLNCCKIVHICYIVILFYLCIKILPLLGNREQGTGNEEKKEYVLSKQLLRSGKSIGANIPEANGSISQSVISYQLFSLQLMDINKSIVDQKADQFAHPRNKVLAISPKRY